jgi:uncharacterized protein
MLAGLARWLRAAGYDTALVVPGASDDAVLEQCRAEDRVLVSRDRRLACEAGRGMRTVLLMGNDMDEHARALISELDLDWTFAPFTRCMIDNALLRPADAEDLARIPAQSRGLPGPFRACPRCARVFWPGSHVRRMNARLRRWRGLARDVAAPAP